MKSIFTNLLFWFVIVGFGGFALVFWIGGYDNTMYVMAALTFGVAIFIVGTWMTTAVEAFRGGLREGEALLCAAIFGIAAYAVYVRIWSVSKVSLGSPDWMEKSPFAALASLFLLMCLVAILFAPGTRGGVVPKRNLILWVLSGLVAGIAVGIVVGVAIAREIQPSALRPAAISQSILDCQPPQPVFVGAYCRALPNRKLIP